MISEPHDEKNYFQFFDIFLYFFSELNIIQSLLKLNLHNFNIYFTYLQNLRLISLSGFHLWRKQIYNIRTRTDTQHTYTYIFLKIHILTQGTSEISKTSKSRSPKSFLFRKQQKRERKSRKEKISTTLPPLSTHKKNRKLPLRASDWSENCRCPWKPRSSSNPSK